jgi:hypothetical protein
MVVTVISVACSNQQWCSSGGSAAPPGPSFKGAGAAQSDAVMRAISGTRFGQQRAAALEYLGN